jgi:ketosteroid isomerase-like protein
MPKESSEPDVEAHTARGQAMSQNLQTVRRGIDAFNRRDVDLLADLTTPDFAWFPALPGTVEKDGYRGREGVERYFGEIEGTWVDLRVLIEELHDLRDGALLLGRTEGRGRASGVEVDAPIGVVYEFRGEKISRCRAYLDHAEALRVAGLEE